MRLYLLRSFSLLLALLSAITTHGQERTNDDEPVLGQELGNRVRVKALLIIDTNARNGEGQSFRGMEKSEKFITNLLNAVGVRPIVLKGDRVSVNSVRGFFRNLPRDPSQVLFFYYIGHGSTRPTPDGDFEHVGPANQHCLELNNGASPIWRKTLRDDMLSRSPRLTVILSDSCSNLVEGLPAPAGGMEPAVKVMGDLLFRHTGIVDINSSTFNPQRGRDETSLCDPMMGGLFASQFSLAVMSAGFDEAQAGRLVTWRRIFSDTSDMVTRMAAGVNHDQHPQAFYLDVRSQGGAGHQGEGGGPGRRDRGLGIGVEPANRGVRVTVVYPDAPAQQIDVYKPDGTTYRGRLIAGDTIFEVYDFDNLKWLNVDTVDNIRESMSRVPPNGEFRFGGRDAMGGVYRATVRLR